MEPMSYDMARLTFKRYRCAGCYGELHPPQPAEGGGYVVLCKNCGTETRGYVSQMYVDRKISDSVIDAREVKKLLIKLGEIPDPLAGKSAEQLKNELGFWNIK
jgi:hypothetical protein